MASSRTILLNYYYILIKYKYAYTLPLDTSTDLCYLSGLAVYSLRSSGLSTSGENDSNQFGRLLAAFREKLNLTQAELADRCRLSQSSIAALERPLRGTKKKEQRIKWVDRTYVQQFIEKLDLWPPESDELMRAAGLTTDRERDEELFFQKSQRCRSLWIFAREILDYESDFYKIVLENLKRKEHPVRYTYFVPDGTEFGLLLKKLKADLGSNAGSLEKHVTCYILPEPLFIFNFAIYNPEIEIYSLPKAEKLRHTMYCCGTKSELGKADTFFTVHTSEAYRLYDWLKGWKNRLNLGERILLQGGEKLFPEDRKATAKSTSLVTKNED
jgi:transcriptional regulator with XRE-family HTH domain